MAVGKGFFAAMLLVAMATAQAGSPKAAPRLKKSSGAKASSVKPAEPIQAPEPQPEPPPPPLRPAQRPAVPARVSFQNGQLTIVAENSTMADVIAQVRTATGIKIETIGGPSGERIAARIGPAPVRDVILSLVQGSQYDFIILGSMTDPQAVERVILTPKMGGDAVAASNAPRPPQPNGNAVYTAPVAETSDDDGNEGFAAPPPPQQATPGQQPADPNAAPKTPEQLLEELRRMEEQRNNPQGRPQRPPR